MAMIAKELITKITLEYGIPEKILTNQSTNFTSEMFKDAYKLLKIEKIQTTAYPENNIEILERSHRILAEYLKRYVNKDQTNWDKWFLMLCLHII